MPASAFVYVADIAAHDKAHICTHNARAPRHRRRPRARGCVIYATVQHTATTNGFTLAIYGFDALYPGAATQQRNSNGDVVSLSDAFDATAAMRVEGGGVFAIGVVYRMVQNLWSLRHDVDIRVMQYAEPQKGEWNANPRMIFHSAHFIFRQVRRIEIAGNPGGRMPESQFFLRRAASIGQT